MIRGRELPHWTDDWTGTNRFCIVRAFHECVMKEAEARQKARAVGQERPIHSKRKQGDNLGKIDQNRGMPEMEEEAHPKDDPSDHRPAKRSKK